MKNREKSHVFHNFMKNTAWSSTKLIFLDYPCNFRSIDTHGHHGGGGVVLPICLGQLELKSVSVQKSQTKKLLLNKVVR